MTIEKRFETTDRLIKSGIIKVSGVYVLDVGALVRIDSRDKETLKAALTKDDGTVIENPMTWDTFTHIFLLNK
jgi:hypothetical protein